MYMRVVTANITTDRLDDFLQAWSANVLPSVQQQPGFINVRMAVDRHAGKVITIGLWESEAAFQNTVTWNQAQIDRLSEFMSAAPPTVDGYEFVMEAGRSAAGEAA